MWEVGDYCFANRHERNPMCNTAWSKKSTRKLNILTLIFYVRQPTESFINFLYLVLKLKIIHLNKHVCFPFLNSRVKFFFCVMRYRLLRCLELVFLFSEEEGGWGIIIYCLGRILLRLLFGFLHGLRPNENAHADIVVIFYLLSGFEACYAQQ